MGFFDFLKKKQDTHGAGGGAETGAPWMEGATPENTMTSQQPKQPETPSAPWMEGATLSNTLPDSQRLTPAPPTKQEELMELNKQQGGKGYLDKTGPVGGE